MNRSHLFVAIAAAALMAFLFVIVPMIGDWLSPERRWSRKWRAQRAELTKLRKKGTP